MDNFLCPQGQQGKPMFGMLRNNRGEVNVMDDSGMSVGADPAVDDPLDPVAAAPVETFSGKNWKEGLSSDLLNSPVVQKFSDDPDGLSKFAEGYNNLEKLLGHEKVPIPKGAEDVEGWNRFNKAMGIPDAAEGYGLSDAEMPEAMKGMELDKNKFAEVAHAHKLTPAQAKGLWKAYNDINIASYNKYQESNEARLNETVNALKSKWGDTYSTNIELGQAVINKFSNDQETNDYLTNTLSQSTKGIEFLAKIGAQFAENKMGEFQMKRFSLAPEEAKAEIDNLTHDLNGVYHNMSGAFPEAQHTEAVHRVNHLRALVNKAAGLSG